MYWAIITFCSRERVATVIGYQHWTSNVSNLRSDCDYHFMIADDIPICNPRHFWVSILDCEQDVLSGYHRSLGHCLDSERKIAVVTVENVFPSILVEQIPLEVLSAELFCFGDLLGSDHLSAEIPLENVLKTEEYSVIKLSASAFEIRVKFCCFWRILFPMSDLRGRRNATMRALAVRSVLGSPYRSR